MSNQEDPLVFFPVEKRTYEEVGKLAQFLKVDLDVLVTRLVIHAMEEIKFPEWVTANLPSSNTVKVVDCGNSKIGVIRGIRQATGYGLKESKDLAELGGYFEVPDVEAFISEMASLGALVEKVRS